VKLIAPLTAEDMHLEFLLSEWPMRDVKGIENMAELSFLQRENYYFDKRSNIQHPTLYDFQRTVVKILLYKDRHIILNALPDNIEWHHARLGEKDFFKLKPIKEKTWMQAFANCFDIKQIAEAIEEGYIDNFGHVVKIRKIQQSLISMNLSRRLILLTTDYSSNMKSPVSILEGNHRAVAFMLEHRCSRGQFGIPTEFILGFCKQMKNCTWYNK
jgi:hypothetical protein